MQLLILVSKSSRSKIFVILALLGCFSSMVPAAPPITTIRIRKIIPKGAISFFSHLHGFGVWLPTKLVLSQKEAGDKNGKTSRLLFKASTKSVNYSVNVYPESLSRSDWETTLDGIQKGMVEALNGKLQKLQHIQLSGFPGREVTVSLYEGQATVRSRVYVTPKGTFAIAAGGYKEPMKQKTKEIDRVFDSFRILSQ